MPQPVRILHLADSHIGAGLPARPRHDRPRRGHDFIASYQRVLDRAREHNVDLIIHAGDVFDRSKPHTTAITAAAQPLLELAAAGIPVVIVPGNHERSVIPASLLFAHANIHIAAEPATFRFVLRGTRIAVAAIPCIRRGSAVAFPEVLNATNWHSNEVDVRILACHQTFESARCGPANYRFRSGEDVVERDTIPPDFAYVAAGHVHRHQVLATPHPGGPPVVYAGSPDRISFAERDEPKGCVLVEIDRTGLTHRFLEHPVRPMRVIALDITNRTAAAVRDLVAAELTQLPDNAVVAIRLAGRSTNGDLRGLNLAALARDLKPDALVNVTARAVEFESKPLNVRRPEHPQSPTTGRRSLPVPPGQAQKRLSAFACLDAPPEPIAVAAADRLAALPTRCGVYALYDAADRLLYIGKSGNVRARVRTHLRGPTGSARLNGWAARISRIEVRPAHSDLEALLVEAELIRRHRPPFNTQMRTWSRYCYLRVAPHQPFDQLEITDDPHGPTPTYGPYRSRHTAEAIIEATAVHFQLAHCPDETTGRTALPLLPAQPALACARYYDHRCTAPCIDRITTDVYAAALTQRHNLLTGQDDTTITDLEREAEQSDDEDLRRRADLLRSTFNHGAALREAERLIDALIILPGPPHARTIATLSRDGLQLSHVEPTESEARGVLARWRKCRAHASAPLPSAIADVCLVGVRAVR